MIIRITEQTPKGTKVIVRSNNDEPFQIGEFKGYDNQFHNNPIPVVNCDGKDYWCMGIVVEFNEKLIATLNTLSYKEQWNHLSLNYKRT